MNIFYFNLPIKASLYQQEINHLIDKQKTGLRSLNISNEDIEELSQRFYQEAIRQYSNNSEYVIIQLEKYKNQIEMSEPTEQQLQEMIANLKEQLKFISDDTIADELIKEIKFRENQLKHIKNKK